MLLLPAPRFCELLLPPEVPPGVIKIFGGPAGAVALGFVILAGGGAETGGCGFGAVDAWLGAGAAATAGIVGAVGVKAFWPLLMAALLSLGGVTGFKLPNALLYALFIML